MLTPNDVSQMVVEVKAFKAKHGQTANFHTHKLERDIFIIVLQEISAGSIDPRSLAISALKLLK